MSDDDRSRGGQGEMSDSIDWEQVGHSLQRTGFMMRTFAVAVGASLIAQALIGLWRWFRRPPGI